MNGTDRTFTKRKRSFTGNADKQGGWTVKVKEVKKKYQPRNPKINSVISALNGNYITDFLYICIRIENNSAR